MQLHLYGKKIFMYRKSVDFRCSIDGLSSLIAREIKHPLQENVYLFLNRKADKLKLLFWHKNGFMLCYKRLEEGRFELGLRQSASVMELNADELNWLLAGLDWHKMREWKELSYDKFS